MKVDFRALVRLLGIIFDVGVFSFRELVNVAVHEFNSSRQLSMKKIEFEINALAFKNLNLLYKESLKFC